MATIPVKWFKGSMQGAPSCGWTTPGSIVAVLDACLIDGFNQVTLDSLVVQDGVATATRAAGHGYLVGQVILIAGATPAELNGEWRVTSVPLTSQFTFACPGISNGTATGTITAKTAPVGGWVKEFSATNKAVYRTANVNSPRSYYRFDDTGNTKNSCIVQAFASMTDIDTGTDQWNAYAANRWWKPDSSTDWQVFADDRTVYFLLLSTQYNYKGIIIFYLGDYESINPSDTDAEVIHTQSTSQVHCNAFSTRGSDGNYAVTALRKDQYGSFQTPAYGWRQNNDHSGYGGASFPSSVDGGMLLSNAWIREQANGYHLRGRFRGAYWILADQPFSIAGDANGRDISGVAGLEGRTIRLMGAYFNQNWSSTYVNGRVAFDITGPWD